MKKMNVVRFLKNFSFYLSFTLYSTLVNASTTVNIDGVKDMIDQGQNMIALGAKLGGMLTVVCSAVALGSGRLEGALAQTICKILIVVGLLIAAGTYFGQKISWGFSL